MAASIVGSPAVSNSTTSPFSPTRPQAATVGNTLLIGFALSTAAASSSITTPTGWSLTDGGEQAGTGQRGRIAIFYRVADGTGNDTPSITFLGDQAVVVFEEWSGVSTHDADGTSSGTSAGNATMPASITTGVNNAFMWTLGGGNSNGGTATLSTAIVTQDITTQHVGNCILIAGSGTASTAGIQSPTVTITSGGTDRLRAVTVSFATGTPASVNPPAGAATAGATSPAVSVGVNLAVPAGAAVAGTTAPAITTSVNAAPPAGAAIAGATAPTIAAGGSVSISPPAGAATAGATAPVVAAAVSLPMVAGVATAGMKVPVITVPAPSTNYRRPLVIVNGYVREIALGDSIATDLVPTSSSTVMPYIIDDGAIFTVPDEAQMLFTITVDCNGYIDVGTGILVEV